MDSQKIISEIQAFILKHRNIPDLYYVGIASAPVDRIFINHNAGGEPHYHWKADNETIAREIEKYCIEKLGTDGSLGEGDETTIHVYIYQKSPKTNP